MRADSMHTGRFDRYPSLALVPGMRYADSEPENPFDSQLGPSDK